MLPKILLHGPLPLLSFSKPQPFWLSDVHLLQETPGPTKPGKLPSSAWQLTSPLVSTNRSSDWCYERHRWPYNHIAWQLFCYFQPNVQDMALDHIIQQQSQSYIQKSRNITPQWFTSSRLFLPITLLQVSLSITTWVCKPPKRTMVPQPEFLPWPHPKTPQKLGILNCYLSHIHRQQLEFVQIALWGKQHSAGGLWVSPYQQFSSSAITEKESSPSQ